MRREKWRLLRVCVEVKTPATSPLTDRDLKRAVERTLQEYEEHLYRSLQGLREPRPTHTRFQVKRRTS
jgi:hypothetical protein